MDASELFLAAYARLTVDYQPSSPPTNKDILAYRSQLIDLCKEDGGVDAHIILSEMHSVPYAQWAAVIEKSKVILDKIESRLVKESAK